MQKHGPRQARPRQRGSSREAVVPEPISTNDLLRSLRVELAPRYKVDTVPGRGNELYIWQPLVTYLLIKVTPLPEGRTSLKVRAEVFGNPFRWLHGHFVASKQVTKAIALAYSKPH